MKHVAYTDDELKAAICQCRLLRAAGLLPRSRATSFTAHVVDYLLDEFHVETCNDRWNALRDRINKKWPKLVNEHVWTHMP